jgi:ComF family protein
VLKRAVDKWPEALLNGLFPQSCHLCSLPSGGSLPLCRACEAELPANLACCARCALPLPPDLTPGEQRWCGACLARPPAFDNVCAPYLYDEQFAALVQQWKYRRRAYLGRLMASLWCRRANADLPEVDLLLPVPLHWRRQWQRGFNQAEQLARLLRAQHPALGGVPVDTRRLRRRRATAVQAGLDASARRSNLRDAFALRRTCEGLRVAVIDDVMTTGATAQVVAGCLRAGGASAVHLWCLARTPRPGQSGARPIHWTK